MSTVPLTKRPWPNLDVKDAEVLVAGFNVSGFAVADQLMQRGAKVTVVDKNTDEKTLNRADILKVLGVDVRLGPEHTTQLPPDKAFEVVIVSPGWRADHPLLQEATKAGIEIWSEIELARRMQSADAPAWLAVTGTNGKSTVVEMLASILQAEGLKAVAAGNIGLPLIEAVLDPIGYDVVAVELSSFQLHYTSNIMAEASAITNIGLDHLDWHENFAAYAAAKGKIYHQTKTACLYNVKDEETLKQLEAADVQEGCRAIGITLATPAPSELGVVEDILVDRAFVPRRHQQAGELATFETISHLSQNGALEHLVFDALCAAGLARAYGVSARAVRAGLAAFKVAEHRSELVLAGAVNWINDSKATNQDSAKAALMPYEKVIWIAGGDTKGIDQSELIEVVRDKLKAVILLGRNPEPFLKPLQELAPKVPTHWVDPEKLPKDCAHQLMSTAVQLANNLAEPGDTVVLAPAAASIDQFENYAKRGELFRNLVHEQVGDA